MDLSDIVINDINLIQYHREVIHPLKLQVKDLTSLGD